MRSRASISHVEFTPAPRADSERGLLGFVSLDIDGTWRADGLTLRRTRSGRLALSFPSRIDRRGLEHPYLRPTCPRARRAIEREVMAALGLEESP